MYYVTVDLMNAGKASDPDRFEDTPMIFAQYGPTDYFPEPFATRGEAYRACAREFGRCTSKIYVDTKGGTRACGWVFESAQAYDDARPGEPQYIREAWVTLVQPQTKMVEQQVYAPVLVKE